MSDSLVLEGSITSDFIGSVFADDSTLLVDGVNGAIPWSVLDGTPTTLAGYGITDAPVVTGHSNLIAWDGLTLILDVDAGVGTAMYYGDVTGNVTGNVTGDVTGSIDASAVGKTIMGDLDGSVRTRDGGTVILDVDTEVLNAEVSGNVTGNVTGNLVGKVIHKFTIGANGTTDYTFSDADNHWFPTTENDPEIFLRRGETYEFNNTSGAHPFEIRVSNGGAAYSTGVTNNGTIGVVIFKVPMSAPSTLYYQCTVHSGMGNTINIV